ncbi:metal-dependent hydrolase [Butyrivibrio sp. XB500-5]|uniref:amidohydrolase family protein n=1 Tax=Butyrivibrio sp. XB500-5 TaxID=2364880 RepID=UPI000EA9E4AE|nr:amidohydrolase family protein [Butyrivibrio sp. XB500-5]RKM62624.1 metal-dependent hydrolase [Butyrivibrio sp. XB500-5]
MVIDFHTHTFPDSIAARAVDSLSKEAHIVAYTDGTVSGLIDSMDKGGIDMSVLLPVATNASQVEGINDKALRVNEKYHDRLISFGCIHPEYSRYKEELRRLKNEGIKGIKIHPVYQKADIDSKPFLDIIYAACENDLIVITHAGLDIGFPGVVNCSPKMCRNVINTIGEFKFVLAHMGGWRNWDEVPLYLQDTSVYLDTSFSSGRIQALSDGYWDNKDKAMLDKDGFIKLVTAFGSRRILFGSDSPWSSQKESTEYIKSLGFSDDDLEKIMSDNARDLLGL